jgi:transcriptional antiterminator NusG
MDYFVIQVKTRGEDKYLRRAEVVLSGFDAKLVWPRRNLRIRRRGEWKDVVAPIFPSYLFLETEEVTPSLYERFRRIPGFYRFLMSNDNIIPLSKEDKELLNHFLSFGEIVDKSLVTFDRNNRIKVVSGPLQGLDGLIVKVDRRKKRAKVKLDLYKDSFIIDFGFEALDNISEKE